MWHQVQTVLHASLERVLTKVALLLPAVVVFFVALILSCLLGALAAYILRALLRAIHLDERMQRGRVFDNVRQYTTLQSPTNLLCWLVFWSFTSAGALIGCFAFAAAYSDSEQLATVLVPYVMHAIGALLIFIIGMIAARFLSRSVLIGAVNLNLQSARLLSQGVKWMILVLAATMALDHMGIGGVIIELAFGILFGGIVLTLALAIGLGSPELVTRSLEHDGGTRPVEPHAQKIHHF